MSSLVLVGYATRYGSTQEVAEAVVVGVVRTAVALTSVEEELRVVRARIALASVILMAIATLVSLAVSRRIARPVEAIRRGALRFAQGDFEHNVPVPRPEELASLAESMNAMARELETRIRAVVHQRAEQEAVFAGMIEGVIAVDPEERLITMNSAAAEMFGVDAAAARGRAIQEIIRNTDLHRFVSLALGRADAVEGEIELAADDERFLQAHGAALRDERGRRVGAVIVLNDVTRMRRLENVRREFVANVSHELRTPITSIGGFVETLRDGAYKDPEEAKRFLGIVSKHVDRLNAIIEDLLRLSRIEREIEQSKIVLEERSIHDVLLSAVEACHVVATEKGTTITLRCAEGLRARINAQLLERAVVNLLDNAVKYSDPGGEVRLEANESPGEVVIRVVDRGVGIAPEHLPRIFERFYRVDKARSRQLGGTGLGLAIAKHIAQAHGGRISVESAPGQGSTFSVHLPTL